MLTAYRSTTHPATGITPYEAMKGATVRTKLDHIQPKVQKSEKDDIMDKILYMQCTNRKWNRTEKAETQDKEDSCLVTKCWSSKRKETNGACHTNWTRYNFYIVHKISGSWITARRATDERTIWTDISHFKLVNAVINTADDWGITEAGESNTTADPGL